MIFNSKEKPNFLLTITKGDFMQKIKKSFLFFISIFFILSVLSCGKSTEVKPEMTELKYSNGMPKEKGLLLKKDGKEIKMGDWTFWYENGLIKKQCTYTDGSLNGLYTEFYENGQKREEGELVNNEKNGKWIFWKKNGQQDEEIEFTNGKKNGKYKSWYENGVQIYEGTYENDKKHGRWVKWFDNSETEEEGYYVNSLKNGKWNKWDQSGKLIETVIYDNGRVGSKRTYEQRGVQGQKNRRGMQ